MMRSVQVADADDEERRLFLPQLARDGDCHSDSAGPVPGKRRTDGTGYWASVSSVLCTMVGTGILGLPYTLKQGGWVGAGLIAVIGLMTNYTGKLVVGALYLSPPAPGDAVRSGRLKGYPAIGRAAYGKGGLTVVHLFHKATLVGVATLFLILAAKFLVDGVGGGGGGFAPSLGSPAAKEAWTKRWTIIAAAVGAVPVVLVRTLGEIGPVTLMGALASVLTVVVVSGCPLIMTTCTTRANTLSHMI